MPQKIHTLQQLFIFPNTQTPSLGPYIITGQDIDGGFHAADTGTKSMFDDFWSEKLSEKEREPIIQAMLNELERQNGEKYRVIRPHDEDTLLQMQ
jgi:protein tyrosine phosphatase